MKLTDFAKILNGKVVNLKRDEEVKGLSIDSRTLNKGELFFALKGEKGDGHDFIGDAEKKGSAGAVVEKEVSGKNLILVEDVSRSLIDFAKWKLRNFQGKKICITGSSGKTSTKELMGKILEEEKIFKTKGNYNNLIGIPLSLWSLKGNEKFAIFEVGMSYKGEIFGISEIIRPEIAIITNIGSVHMMNFHSRRELASAKFELVENLAEDGILFYNGDDPLCREFSKKFCVEKRSVGVGDGNHWKIKNLKISLNGMEFYLEGEGEKVFLKSKLISESFSYNISFSYAVARECGISQRVIVDKISEFSPYVHRGEVVKLKNGAVLIDDTYNSNPEALLFLLNTVFKIRGEKNLILVLGEMKELGLISEEKHREVGKFLKNKWGDISNLYAISGDARFIAEEVDKMENFFENWEDCLEKVFKDIGENSLIVIKGSRGVALDLLVEKIVEEFGIEN